MPTKGGQDWSRSEVTQLSPMGEVAAGSANVLQEPTAQKKPSQLSGTDHESQLYSNTSFLAQIFVAKVFQQGGERAACGAAWRMPTRVHQTRAKPPCLQFPCAAQNRQGTGKCQAIAPPQPPAACRLRSEAAGAGAGVCTFAFNSSSWSSVP